MWLLSPNMIQQFYNFKIKIELSAHKGRFIELIYIKQISKKMFNQLHNTFLSEK